MRNSVKSPGKGRRQMAVAFLFAMMAAMLLPGCVANDLNAMPWATPDPGEGSVNLPGNFSGQ